MKKVLFLLTGCFVSSAFITFAADRSSDLNPTALRQSYACCQPTVEAIKSANNNLTSHIPYKEEIYNLRRPIDMDKFNRLTSASSYYVTEGMTSWHKDFKVQFINVSLNPSFLIMNNTPIIHEQNSEDQIITISLIRNL